MAELRHHRNGGATSIPWSTSQDSQLSFIARGLLGYALSLPPGWAFSAERITNETPNEGKRAVLNGLKELEATGYRRVVTERGSNGQLKTIVEFAFMPVPEWITEFKAKQSKARKRPGPKLSAGAKKAAQESANTAREIKLGKRTKPQVAPEVNQPESGDTDSGQAGETNKTAGRTGSQPTGIRPVELLRSTPTERDTHTQTAPSSADDGEVETDGVCVSDPLKNQPPADADQVEAGMTAARRGIAVGARNKLTGSQLRRAQVAVEQAIARGCTPRQITEAVRDEHTDDRTTHPGSAVERALEGLTPAPEGASVPEEPEGSHRDREADEAAAARLAAMATGEPAKREPVTVVERRPGRDWRDLVAAPEGCKSEVAKSESTPEPVAPRQRAEDDEEAERARQLALLTAEFGPLD